ncbi:MAG: hypothetical protein KKC72_08400 [Alphaproteobacteria bacterium]|nr:hypothetical protein [Alphaproteobacteria bacterium]
MMRSPAQAFADLSDALTRMTALNLDMQTDRVGQDAALITAWDAQADRAMAAHCELVINADALRDIEAMLAVTYGGVPS